MIGFWDPTFVLVIPGVVLALWAQARVRSAYGRYSRVGVSSGINGARAARAVLDADGLRDVAIEEIPGELTDHYDPRSRVLRLSVPVSRGGSVAAVGIAAHEAGHALQHAHNYGPLAIRMAIVPVTQFGSTLAWPLAFAGLILQIRPLITLGIWLFATVVAFQAVTLPVEFNASARARRRLVELGVVEPGERRGIDAVLNAAALTYVAAMAVAVLNLLRLILLRGSRR